MLNQVGIKKIKEEEHNFIVHVLFVVVKQLDICKRKWTSWNRKKNWKRKKNKEKVKKLISPSEGAGIFDTAVGTATDLFVHHGIPWMAKKSIEMGRYGTSELMRNKNLQKKL